jgi:hypothetical protein
VQRPILLGTGNVLLGKTFQLTATVTGTTNTSVNWSVNGIAGGSTTTGTISADGLYTAPPDMPSPANARITATSAASPASSASAQITITSDITIGISPGITNVELGTQQN